MRARVWSFALQWSRVGIGAILFLIAARYLSLIEIGLFATAFAPIRLTQGLHKAGIADTVILFGHRHQRLDALFALSLMLGLGIGALLLITGLMFRAPILMALAVIPVLNGVSAVSEGLLRREMALRNLALRTITTQTLAAGLALTLLTFGLGVWALVGFAVLNAGLNCALSLMLARWAPKGRARWRALRLILGKTSQIAARDLLSSALIPLAQLAVGLCLGMSAAGAFQIATRILSLIDALAIAPLRFIALPQLRRDTGAAFFQTLQDQLRLTSDISIWIWAGTFATAPTVLTLAVGADHARNAAPILEALVLFGLTGALLMPFNQALTAQGHTRLVLLRAALLLGLATLLAAPMLTISATSTASALSAAAVLNGIWYLSRALPRLDMVTSDLTALARPLFAGALMATVLIMTSDMFAGLTAIPAFLTQVVFGTVLYTVCLALMRWRKPQRLNA
ncbi:MAG: oligosaccharide flippase family protein [Aestuariivita sp.]|uniref:oligosaccharide flippase family protein n=1 Tax=Aestuariivita sp. TaxID=1872407 RepID=UPI003BB02345